MPFLVIFLFFLLVFAMKVITNINNDREWNYRLFENEYEEEGPRHDPLLEAYISIGALMVRNDTASYGEKILYLNNYFSKHFPETHYDFGRSFTGSLKNPVKTKVIMKWMSRILPQRAQRLQVNFMLKDCLPKFSSLIQFQEFALLY